VSNGAMLRHATTSDVLDQAVDTMLHTTRVVVVRNGVDCRSLARFEEIP
jgi:hypothetical protein